MPNEISQESKRKAVADLESALALNDIFSELLEAITNNLKPDEVFEDKQLAEWAMLNGYEEKES